MPFSVLYLFLNIAAITCVYFLGKNKLRKYRLQLYLVSAIILFAANAVVLFKMGQTLGLM